MSTGDRSVSGQEHELLRLLLLGQTVAAAAALYVSTRTAEGMLARLRQRAGAPTLYALGAKAEQLGWHESGDVVSIRRNSAEPLDPIPGAA